MSATQTLWSSVLAQGVPIDCGSLADGLTGCFGRLPAVGAAVVAAVVGAGLVGQAVLAALLPRMLHTMVRPPLGGAVPGGGAPRTLRIGGEQVAVLPAIGPSVPFTGRVLLLGEGNFSFTAANLALGRNVPRNVTATAFSPDGRYPPDVQAGAQQLTRSGAAVRLGVDVRAPLPADLAGGAPFNTIVFQFPHPGGGRAQMAALGQTLMRDFFANAAPRLAPGGTVVLTLRSDYYVSRWRPVDAARAAGLRLESVTEFHPGHYPGYRHVTTAPGATPPDVSHGFTFVFTRI